MQLDIVHKGNESYDVLALIGEVDAFTAPELKEALLPLTECSGKNVRLDLSQTTYMDSTGIGVIIAAYKTSKSAGSSLLIQGVTSRVRRLFDITGLSDIVEIDEQVKEDQS